MKKVAPPRPPVPAVALTTLRRWSRHIRSTPIEREIVDYVLWAGRDLRWTMFVGINVADVLGCNLDRNTSVVKHAMTKLVRRGWLKKGINDVGQRYVQLTPAFIEACELADQRYEVRRVLGPMTWEKINGSAEVADALHKLTLTMTQARYRDRVKAAARAFIDGTGRGKLSGNESHPDRVGKTPSQGVNRTLRLIDGERKSGA